MNSFIINPSDFTQLSEIVTRIRYSLRNKVGFSLVRIGDAENQVMAQGVIYNEKEIERIWWAKDYEWTGITLPNYEARNELIKSVSEADMVGVLHQSDLYIYKPLSEQIFTICNIKPKQICYGFINIYFPKSKDFVNLLRIYKVLLIGKEASNFAQILKSYYNIDAVGVISIYKYEEITEVVKLAQEIDYDIVLISAGSNAVILATTLAKTGKVAIDIGRAANEEYWKADLLHPHNVINTYNGGQPFIRYYTTSNKTLESPSYIKSYFPKKM